jgi:hypothetical protein
MLDSILGSLCCDTFRRASHEAKRFNQPDLFRTHRSTRQPQIPEQTGLLSLVKSLLMKTLSDKAAVMTKKAGGDEQDHG